MPTWLELLLLGFASMFWPTLIVIVVVALRVSHPIKVLAWFLAGGLLTTISVGTVIVFELQGSSLVSGSSPTIDAPVYITMGLLSLLAAFVLLRRTKQAPAKPRHETKASANAKPPLAERAVEGGAPVAFAAGVVLNIVPGTFPIVALKDIAEVDASNAAKVAAIIGFYLIMFTFVEVPIVSYVFAPERTTVAVNNFNDWLKRNGRTVAAYVLAVVGAYLTVRGIAELL